MNTKDTVEIAEKRKGEMFLAEEMIRLYCKRKHGKKDLCKQCAELLDYALSRIKVCPVMKEKTFCSSCKIHCYKAEQREAIKKVMRYAGPRMMFYHPVLAFKHALEQLKK